MKQQNRKRIIVSVTTDLISDNRVNRTCYTLVHMGFEVLLVGRLLPNSLPLSPRSYSMKRLNLLFRKGPLFYACFNIRLFWLLLFSGFDLLLSNDLDTLPANFFVSRLKKKPLVYDSHEFFTEVPELTGRPRVKRIWEWMEKQMVPKLKHAYTVCDSIARIYAEKYGVAFRVVRNFPLAQHDERPGKSPSEFAEEIILYQGAVNVGRGLENAIKAMKYMDSSQLLIAGAGDITEELEKLATIEGVQNKVQFTGKLPMEELVRLTPKASLGLSLEEDRGLNYRYALPNKLFDYIQARVPVVVSDLPEMAAIVRRYKVGEVTFSNDPESLAELFLEMLTNQEKREKWKQNLELAARELTWENESVKIREIFETFR